MQNPCQKQASRRRRAGDYKASFLLFYEAGVSGAAGAADILPIAAVQRTISCQVSKRKLAHSMGLPQQRDSPTKSEAFQQRRRESSIYTGKKCEACCPTLPRRSAGGEFLTYCSMKLAALHCKGTTTATQRQWLQVVTQSGYRPLPLTSSPFLKPPGNIFRMVGNNQIGSSPPDAR